MAAPISAAVAPALQPEAVCAAGQYSQRLRPAPATAICSPSNAGMPEQREAPVLLGLMRGLSDLPSPGR